MPLWLQRRQTYPGVFSGIKGGGRRGFWPHCPPKGPSDWGGGLGSPRVFRGSRGRATYVISTLKRNYLQELPGSSMPDTHSHTTSVPPAGGHQHTRTVVKPLGPVCPAGLCQTTRCQSYPSSPVALRQSGEVESPFTTGWSLFTTWHFKKCLVAILETTTVRATSV